MLKYLILILLLIPFSYAHLEAGIDRDIGNYVVDFGWEPENLNVGELSTMQLTLLDAETLSPIDADQVWVRISAGRKIYFSGFLNPQQKIINWNFIFPDENTYIIKTRFTKDGKNLVETDFEVIVGEEKKQNNIIVGVILILIGAILVFAPKLLKRRKRK